MSRVFIINRAGHDHSDAERFGELVYCTDGTQDRFNASQMYRTFSELFNNASPSDFILPTSLNILCCVACAVFARRFGVLNLLLYKNGKYIERRLMLDSMLHEIEAHDRGPDGLAQDADELARGGVPVDR